MKGPVTRSQKAPPRSDTRDLPTVVYGVFVYHAGGTLRVTLADGSVLAFTVRKWDFVPVAIRRIHKTGTTARGLIIFW